tara:strand:+ start:535 stop:1236 length:702 start_codon:yes stop_codon:yes gene_type:complete
MRNFFRLFVPLIINPYYYIKKIKKRSIKNFFEYENKPYNRISLISLAISKIISKKGFENCNYLEIGCFDNKAFDTIPLPLSQKIGIDPLRGGTHRMTSDEFFSKNEKFFDVIFIDGLHTYDQCSKDCINAMKFLNTNGLIILHDMLPRSKTEETQKFSGDAWKVAVDLSKSENLEFIIANIDQGVGLIKTKENSKYIKQNDIKDKKFNDYKETYYNQLPISNIENALNFIKLD